jgi:murein DD-endopeptidase MepM/ murein hydrolase activator NlpD
MSGFEGEPSFDPRSWARKPGATHAQTPAKKAVGGKPPVRKPPTRKPPSKGGGMLVAVWAVAAVLVSGGGFLAWRTFSKPPEAPGSTVPGVFRRSFAVGKLGDLVEVLKAEGLSAAQADAVGKTADAALGASGGDLRAILTLSTGKAPTFQTLELRRADGSGVMLKPGAGGALVSEALASDLKVEIKVVRGEMDAKSFYSSAVAAGVVDALVPEFAKAFSFDFDFQREIQPGDVFEAAFERRVDRDGQVFGAERLVYASLQTQTKSRALYLFGTSEQGEPQWYDGNGVSIVRGLMRTPVEGARISSSFGTRTHPVLGYTRMHKGTDFAVPIGTTVYASGDGTVDFVGPHGGHGNYVRIRHNTGLQTAYAHLSAFEVKVGDTVRQGQAVALSGNTGLSSGPHLHYEVIVDGAEVDPMTYETTSGRSLAGAELVAFQKERDRIDALRASQNR